MKGLEKIITEQLEAMEANVIEPSGMEMQSVYLDGGEKDNSKWQNAVTAAIESAKAFEIHCWDEEIEWIELALKYGTEKADSWKYGKIITGKVTPKFKDMLLTMPKPEDIEIYNKMTPFFNVFLDDTFQSSHYGTEIHIRSK